jgi:hypothetical protein
LRWVLGGKREVQRPARGLVKWSRRVSERGQCTLGAILGEGTFL